MRIRLDKVGDEPFRWSEKETIAVESMERPDLLGLTEVEWSGSVAKAPPGYRLLATLRYGQTLACGRCLKPCESRVESEIDLVVMVNPPPPMAGEVRLEESDLGVLALASEELDTDPVLREQIDLNIPMSELCRPDCAGLCPRCGADRNETPDCCAEQSVDPRWRALADLKPS
ncbi:MAG: DUF177 domain-containing protein [Acidobacteriota bacterium]|nr:DUF177 domain-containing protein [Acidobacteriota bacterium]